MNFAQYHFQILQIPYNTASYITFGKREIENLLHQPLKYGKISGIALIPLLLLQLAARNLSALLIDLIATYA